MPCHKNGIYVTLQSFLTRSSPSDSYLIFVSSRRLTGNTMLLCFPGFEW